VSDWIQRLSDAFAVLPSYGKAGLILLFLYALQSELRFGARARKMTVGTADRGSTIALSVTSAIPVIGLVIAMKRRSPFFQTWIPSWLRDPNVPGLPTIAWIGIAFGIAGFLLRLWAVVRLRNRYTRTLLIQDDHVVERGGPYRFVRHPGYLGSLLLLNSVALASGNLVIFLVSLVATSLAYRHRIRAEDAMLTNTFGDEYAHYRNEVPALIPFVRVHRGEG
jgi:protein-S-isoprenylcysteine O-methyltransferase